MRLSGTTLRKVPHHAQLIEAHLISKPSLVVALGASAGGVAALQQFFQALPERCHGLCYVVVQHLSPNRETVVAEILQRGTPLKVSVAEPGQKLEGQTIVLCPPGRYAEVSGSALNLRQPREEPYLPVDHFLGSLASEVGERAVAVILSGTGSDGAAGVVAIKEAGGLVMVQDETHAVYSAMPLSALETGAADFVLPPGEMARELANYLDHLGHSESLVRVSSLSIGELLTTLHEQGGINFSEYKKDMLMRRVRRRMAIRQTPALGDYRRLLCSEPREVSLLTRDILIGVTRFFRDPEAFRELDHQIVTTLLESRRGEALRLWVAGCSTGEEVYSLVILFRQRAAQLGQDLQLRVFATDLDEDSLRVASLGLYRDNIAVDVPGEFLQKYFVQRGEGYQVCREVRDCVLFARHDLTKDPPFTNLDLISCRNLLIYFEPALKQKVLSFFHFGLLPKGCLFLGASETPLELQENFVTCHANFRIYQKLGLSSGLYRWPVLSAMHPSLTRLDPVKELSLGLDEGYRVLLEEHCPPAILVDPGGQVLHVFVNADHYLKFPAGAVLLGLTDLLSPKLGAVASAALSRAFREQPTPEEDYPEIVVQQHEDEPPLGLRIRPLYSRRGSRDFALVTFRVLEFREPRHSLVAVPEMDAESQRHILTLSQELRQLRSNFQVTVEELETTNEELQATNEEFQSTSQEYQSTAEQLRRELRIASQEALELTDRYEQSLEELKQQVADYQSYLEAAHPAVLFLDEKLRVLRANQGVSRYLPILAQDVGRPVEHIATRFSQADFLRQARQVVNEGSIFNDCWPVSDGGTPIRIALRPFGKSGVVVNFSDSSID